MTYKEIKAAIVKKLREIELDIPIYGTDTTEGYQTPCFFVSINVELTEGGYNVMEKTLYAEILKVQPAADEVDALEFFQKIEDAFYPKLQVGDRFLTTSDFSHDFEGDHRNVPYIEFQSNFYDAVHHKTDAKTLQEVRLKEDV